MNSSDARDVSDCLVSVHHLQCLGIIVMFKKLMHMTILQIAKAPNPLTANQLSLDSRATK